MQRERDIHATPRGRSSSYARGSGRPEVGTEEYYIAAARRLGIREPGTDPAPEGGGSAA
jgi:hypothetical protein